GRLFHSGRARRLTSGGAVGILTPTNGRLDTGRGPPSGRRQYMRIAIDPVPLVLGTYAYVADVLGRAAERRAAEDAASLGRRFAGQKGQSADREIQRLTRTLHT